jgi:hypothetical protein
MYPRGLNFGGNKENTMLAMQYSFTLPTDYDMSIVDRRITEKGHLIDEFPGLILKAYLWSTKSATEQENRYAPFYVWQGGAGLNDFICGPGFVGLTQSFGWPSVLSWSVWNAALTPHAKESKFATRSIIRIQPYAALQDLRNYEADAADEDLEKLGALASVAAFEPATWSLVRLQLWGEAVPVREGATAYDVGYVSFTGHNGKR